MSFFQPDRKKTLKWGLVVIAVCLAISGIYLLTNLSQRREATAQEVQAAAAYVPGWDVGDMTHGEYILSRCQLREETETYRIYDSDTLAAELADCHRDLVIQEGTDGSVYLRYFTGEDDMVVLSFGTEGLTELSIYHSATDELYYQTAEEAVVWSKFRTGFQFGT